MNRSKRTQEAIQNPQIDILAELRYKLTGCKNANNELKTQINTYTKEMNTLKERNQHLKITLTTSILINIATLLFFYVRT